MTIFTKRRNWLWSPGPRRKFLDPRIAALSTVAFKTAIDHSAIPPARKSDQNFVRPPSTRSHDDSQKVSAEHERVNYHSERHG